jgi:sorbitol/mannitol transport system permease protein
VSTSLPRNPKPFDVWLLVRTLAAWGVTLLLIFPIVFLAMTAFKTELQAIEVPTLWAFTPTTRSIRW